MDVLNVNEILTTMQEKVKRGSAVMIFDNSDDAISFVSFCNVACFAYGIELPIDVSIFLTKY